MQIVYNGETAGQVYDSVWIEKKHWAWGGRNTTWNGWFELENTTLHYI
jgi:hypothetical protein